MVACEKRCAGGIGSERRGEEMVVTHEGDLFGGFRNGWDALCDHEPVDDRYGIASPPLKHMIRRTHRSDCLGSGANRGIEVEVEVTPILLPFRWHREIGKPFDRC